MKAITKSALILTAISGISSVMLGLTALAAEKAYEEYIDTSAMRATRAVKLIEETTADVLTFNNTYNYTYNLNRVNGKFCSIKGNGGYTGNYKNCQVTLESNNGNRSVAASQPSNANNTTVSATCSVPSGTVETGEYVFIIYKGTENTSAYLNRAVVDVTRK